MTHQSLNLFLVIFSIFCAPLFIDDLGWLRTDEGKAWVGGEEEEERSCGRRTSGAELLSPSGEQGAQSQRSRPAWDHRCFLKTSFHISFLNILTLNPPVDLEDYVLQRYLPIFALHVAGTCEYLPPWVFSWLKLFAGFTVLKCASIGWLIWAMSSWPCKCCSCKS